MSLNPPAVAADAARATEHAIDPPFVRRWSPRAFAGEAIDEGTLLSFLEAAEGRFAFGE